MHPLPDPLGPLKTQYNPLEPLPGPPDFGLRDLWLSESYHPRHLFENGFELHDHVSAVTDWNDGDEVRDVYCESRTLSRRFCARLG